MPDSGLSLRLEGDHGSSVEVPVEVVDVTPSRETVEVFRTYVRATDEGELAIKLMVVFSITVLFLVLSVLAIIYLYVRFYQEERKDRFDELLQFDQIDHLIRLIDEQERILDTEVDDDLGREEMEAMMEEYKQLHREFTRGLDSLHEMIAGMSKKEFELKADREKGAKGMLYRRYLSSWGRGRTDWGWD